MKFTIHANNVQWQREYLPRFTAGLVEHGGRVEHSTRDEADVDAVNIVFANNSWRNTVQNCHRKKIPCITVGRCFFGDRFKMVAIGWDDFNAAADFCLPDTAPPYRWEQHGVELAPWRSLPDGYVLVCGEFRNMDAWYAELKRSLDERGASVRFRPHPFVEGIPNGWRKADGPKQDGIRISLTNAAVNVTYDSISGCDSVIAGVPTVCYGERAMARPVSWASLADYWSDPDNLPDREPWAQRLAYCQWDHAEITRGEWWEHLKSGLPQRERAVPETKRDRYSLQKLRERQQLRREQKLR
jgi:hypothetical protein